MDEPEKSDQKPRHRFRYYAALCFSFFSFAFYMNIIGLTLEDLSIQLNCHVQQISTALSIRTIVNFLSGVLGRLIWGLFSLIDYFLFLITKFLTMKFSLSIPLATFTIHYFNRQLQLVFFLVLYALTSAYIPFMHSFWPFFVQSIFSGRLCSLI